MKTKQALRQGQNHRGQTVQRKNSKGNGGKQGASEAADAARGESPQAGRKRARAELILALPAVIATFLWAYWPTLAKMVNAWEQQPDYSHGYLVVPLALIFCWARRDRFPAGAAGRIVWPGLLLILLSLLIRITGAHYYVDAIDAWSMVVWAAGVVWLLGGWRVFLWASPSIGFLLFMIPLPWSAERWLSLPLQRIATKLSTWILQVFGQPAIAEGNTIWLGENHLEVEQACSGLRIFVGIFALAFAYVILVRRTWWERLLLLLSALPIALVANATRIVVTGLLYQLVSGEAAYKFTHDVSGWVMIPYAALLFALVLWYLGGVTREVESIKPGEVLRDAVV